MVSYLGKLQKLTEGKLIWIGPFLEFRRKQTDVMLMEDVHNVNPSSIELFEKLDKLLSDKLNAVKALPYVSFNSLFLEPKKSFHDSCFVFKDTDHYSLCGEELISKSVNKGSIELIKNEN